MIIDTHIHESKFSLDSKVSLTEIISRAKEIGLDGICITDHDNNDITEEARELSRKTGFLIIPGVEILTYEGDMVVFGLKDIPKERVHAADLLELVKQKGGVGISAHPYRQNNRGMGDFIRSLKGLSGIEGFNGNTDIHNNLKAYRLALDLGIPVFGASDAHHRHEVGKYATFFHGVIRDEKDFIEAVKTGKVSPMIYQQEGFIKLDEFNNCNIAV